MRLTSLLLACALVAPPSLAAAQDLVAVAPAFAKVEYEDARVRIVRLHVPEHAFVATHDRPRRVVVSLSANDVRLTQPDGTTRLTRTEAGSFAWSEPGVRSVQNLAGPVDNIVVELKQATEPTVAVAAPPKAPTAEYLNEPLHRWAFENQYVRVYDVRIPPGKTTAFHRHAYDQVVVYVSGGHIVSQVEGQRWAKAQTIEPGRVEAQADAAQPVTHRVRNVGKVEYHTVVVQFLK